MRRRSASLSFEYRVADDWTLTGAGGVSFGGDITVQGVRHALGAGPLAMLGVSYRLLDGDGWEPFALFSAAGSMSSVTSTPDFDRIQSDFRGDARVTALDARFGFTVGEVFANAVAPYATVRGFGGPILWKGDLLDRSGTDKYHFQVGLGLLVTAGVLDAFFEVVPLGERSATFGVATAF